MRRGTTLLEVLVGCGIFAFLVVSAIAILNVGTNGYVGISSKVDVARQLNMFESDITQELKRASLSTVGIYTPNNDYRWALWFQTAMNSPNNVDSNGNPTVPLGDPIIQITTMQNNQMVPKMQRYVLYYVTRMDPALHESTYGYLCSSYDGGTNPISPGPDTVCPHKWLIKKELYLLNGQTTGTDTIGPQSGTTTVANLQTYITDASVTEDALNAETDSTTPTSVIHRVRIMAENVLSFEVTRLAVNQSSPYSPPQVSATGPIILFDLKVFKSYSAKGVTVGETPASTVNTVTVSGAIDNQMVGITSSTDNTGTVTVHTSSTVNSYYSGFTVQLDNRIIPENP